MSKPVIFLAFSNDRDDYLPLINRERKNIVKTLREHHDNDYIKVESEAASTLEDIFDFINSYHNQISIFHYGGHAGGTSLRLETAEADNRNANAQGLAQLLGMEENLQLVFLNGCATKPQVRLLLDNGVKAVIATSVPIQDQMATEFAEQFYLALANGSDIQRAFEVTKAFIASKYNRRQDIQQYRSIVLGEEETSDDLPWGIYINEKLESNLSWKLPIRTDKTNILKNRFDYESRLDVNDILIDLICEDIAKYNKDLDDELSKEELDIPSIRREIVDSFPTPIGEHLRKLFTRSNDPSKPDDMEQFTIVRLEQLAMTYFTTFQFASFIMLSQLWDIRFKDAAFKIDEEYIPDLNRFFSLHKQNYHTFNYAKLILAITDIFDKNKITYFIEELHRIKTVSENQQSDFYQAYIFLQELLEALDRGEIKSEDVEGLCLDAETHLGAILREIAFLVKYKLVTIKNIELVKNRHETARFRHNQITLNRALTVANTGIAEVGIEFENFTDNKSVIFIKTKEDKVDDFLNLTPFIIDENALNSDYSSKLFMYIFQTEENYYYQFLNNPKDPPLQVSPDNYRNVKEQFDRFKAEIFGKEYTPKVTKKRVVGGSRFSRKR
jgi:hypothetical protein